MSEKFTCPLCHDVYDKEGNGRPGILNCQEGISLSEAPIGDTMCGQCSCYVEETTIDERKRNRRAFVSILRSMGEGDMIDYQEKAKRIYLEGK